MAFKVCVLLGGLALLCSFADASMQCFHLREKDSTLLSEVKNAVNDLPVFNTCPPPLINQDQEFCCYGWDLKPYCCDAGNVILNWSVIAVVLLIILMLLSTIVSCVCCLCCPCCCLYKRRQGRVYHHKQSVITTSSQTPIRQPQSTDYQPIAKSHTNLPPGAYPVFPPGSGPKYYTRSP